MTTSNDRAQEVAAAAMEQLPQTRLTFIDQICAGDEPLRAQVQQLLQRLEVGGEFPAMPAGGADPAGHLTSTRLKPHLAEGPGSSIGNYRILQVIGEGGFGNVYMAEQERPIRRRVALKIIKLGMDTNQVIARFEVERQALAMMDHPSIAKVLDAGATETGRPYFVMELVRGVPITNYCDSERLSTRQRLELFIPVCRAVQHAHQKGIVHRDLKPSNVMVTISDGIPIPKIIDFGIAKATNAQLTERTYFTEYRQLLGTPEYMSPEQAEASGIDIDTRSDIYSLGVLLYELLTGTTPFDPRQMRQMGYGDIQRMIREIEPPRPSTRLSTLGETLSIIAAQRRTESRKLGQMLRGELDWIVMKCLEKDRTRRYEAAASLANDIQRHLDNEQVLARPATRAYRVQKFISRHKRGVGVTAVTVLMFIGLMIALIIQTRRALSSQKLEAEQRRIAEGARDRERTTEGLAKHNLIKGLILVGDKILASGQETEARKYYGQALDTAKTFGIPEAPALISLLPIDEQLPLMGHYGESSGAGGFIGHTKNATCVVLRRDGRTAITASEDGTIKVWDLISGREIRTLIGHSGGVALVALAPDDRTLLSASHKGEVWLWDVEGTESIHLSEGGPDVWALAISPDGGTALAGSVGGQIRKWDLTTRTELPPFDVNNMHTRAVAYLAFSPDGQRVLSGGHDSCVKLWEAASGKCIQTLAGHGGPVNCVLFLPDGRSAISASFDGTLRTWNLETGAKIHEFRGHQAEIWRVALSPDGKTAFSAGRDETVRSWDVSSGRQIRSFSGQVDDAMGVAVAGDGKLVVATGGVSFLRAWDCRPDRGIGPLDFPDAITSVAMSDQRMILFGSSQGRLILWDRDARRPLQEFSKAASAIKSAAISGDGAHVLSVAENGLPTLWEVASGKTLPQFRDHLGNVNCVAFATDDLALCGGDDGVIRMWSVRDGQEKRNFPGNGGAVTAISVGVGGRSVISVSKDGKARVWDLAGGAPSRDLPSPKAVIAAALGPDGQSAVTLEEDGVIRMWDVVGGRQTGSTPVEKIPPPTAMALSPDGHIAWTCASDGAVTAWDTVSGSRIRSLVTHTGQATCIAANGSCVVSGGRDKTIRLWDLSRPAGYREFEKNLESVHKSLNTNPNDATALAVLGEWYAFRQFDHWAVDLLEGARNGGAQVSPLMLAHCYWNLSESDPAYAAKALEQFQSALKHNEAPESYLTLCMKAVSRVQARSN